ncbi:hypothetical protein [Streptomyces sp. PD-S100-1]|uniref:hypothetical protein n=1 Tax=Streptomyces sp. PD-S100-1 TaxID=3394351 RepID=UPI0039BC5BE9
MNSPVVRLPVYLQVGSYAEPCEAGWIEIEVGRDTESSISSAVAAVLRAAADVLDGPPEAAEEVPDAAADA